VNLAPIGKPGLIRHRLSAASILKKCAQPAGSPPKRPLLVSWAAVVGMWPGWCSKVY